MLFKARYVIIQARKLACKGFRAQYFNEGLLFANSKQIIAVAMQKVILESIQQKTTCVIFLYEVKMLNVNFKNKLIVLHNEK